MYLVLVSPTICQIGEFKLEFLFFFKWHAWCLWPANEVAFPIHDLRSWIHEFVKLMACFLIQLHWRQGIQTYRSGLARCGSCSSALPLHSQHPSQETRPINSGQTPPDTLHSQHPCQERSPLKFGTNSTWHAPSSLNRSSQDGVATTHRSEYSGIGAWPVASGTATTHRCGDSALDAITHRSKNSATDGWPAVASGTAALLLERLRRVWVTCGMKGGLFRAAADCPCSREERYRYLLWFVFSRAHRDDAQCSAKVSS